jgi:hypothetical protein
LAGGFFQLYLMAVTWSLAGVPAVKSGASLPPLWITPMPGTPKKAVRHQSHGLPKISQEKINPVVPEN